MWSFPLIPPLPSPFPPATLLIGVDSSFLGVVWYVLCALLSSPWLPKRPYGPHQNIPLQPQSVLVLVPLCASCGPILYSTLTISLRILALIRPLYSLCDNQLYYILFILFYVYSIRTSPCFLLRFAKYYSCCMFVSASTAVPMHTCQPYP